MSMETDIFYFLFFPVLEIKPRACLMVGSHSPTELLPQLGLLLLFRDRDPSCILDDRSICYVQIDNILIQHKKLGRGASGRLSLNKQVNVRSWLFHLV